MLSLPPSVRLFVSTQPVDGRKGADSLMVLVRDVFGHDPLSGHLFVFFSKRCDRVRVVSMWSRITAAVRPRLRYPATLSANSATPRLPRLLLQVWQQVTRFVASCVPPWLCGVRWSSVSFTPSSIPAPQ